MGDSDVYNRVKKCVNKFGMNVSGFLSEQGCVPGSYRLTELRGIRTARSTAQHVAQNSKREQLAQQNAAQCCAVLRGTALVMQAT